MKKILCFFLAIALVFSFTACTEENKSANKGIDLEYYANLGQMPECKYALGTKISKVKTELEEIYNTVEESVYQVTEGEKTVLIDGGTFRYYYRKDNEQGGISYIVNFEKAFGFEIGTISVELLKALEDYEYKEEEINDDNAFFVLGAAEGKVFRFDFFDCSIAFLFINDSLYATAIYNTQEWQ